MRKRKQTLWLLLALLVVAVVAFLVHLGEHAVFGALRSGMRDLQDFADDMPVRTALVYFVAYVLNAALSLPFGGALTVAAGAMFGFEWGLVLAAVSASAGSIAGFVVSRYFLHDRVERRFGARLAPIQKGLREEGAFYLFALRMVPVFPYWLLNLLMGLTKMRAWTYWWVSAIGLLPLEAAYVFAGTRLAVIEKPGDILTPGLGAAILALGVVPLLMRRIVRWVEQRFFRHDPP